MQSTQSQEFPVYSRLPIEIVSGEGVYVFDSDGQRYIDFYGGHASALLGYRHPALLAALISQAETIHFQTNLVNMAVRDRAAEKLCALAPEGLDRVFFVNSGAEANENALRLACKQSGRAVVVAVEGGFHGRTAAAAACTEGSERWYGFPRRPFDLRRVPFGDEDALREAVDGDVAALIFEAIQGVAGSRPLPSSFLGAAEEAAAECGAFLIADEVQCGMGRSGLPFAFEHAGIQPHFVTLAKGLAGGFPAGAVLARSELVDQLSAGDLGTTFGGGPMAAALIEAVVQELDERRLAEVRRLSARIQNEALVGPVKEIQGRGLLLALRLNCPARDVLAKLRTKGILAGVAADPALLRLMPPLVIEDEHVDALVQSLSELG